MNSAFSALVQRWLQRTCALQVQLQVFVPKKPGKTHQGDLASWGRDTSLEDPVRDAHKVPRPDSNATHNPAFLRCEPLAAQSQTWDNEQGEGYAFHCKLEAPGPYFWITAVMTSPRPTYVTFVGGQTTLDSFSQTIVSKHLFKNFPLRRFSLARDF